jgi:hypothetical protein
MAVTTAMVVTTATAMAMAMVVVVVVVGAMVVAARIGFGQY